MKVIWKGLIGLGTLLLGLALWIAGSIVEGIAAGLAGESFFLTRSVMGIGFFLIFFGPIFFWIILPLKDRWYESHPKRFIAAITPFVLSLLLIFGVVISGIIHEPQLPTYSFNTTVEDNKLIVDIQRISSGDLPDDLTLKLFNPDGEQVDFDYVSNSDLKDGKERVELNLAYFGAPKADNFTLIIENVRDETIYQEEIEVAPPKIIIEAYNISIDDVGVDKLYLDSIKVLLRNEGSISVEINKIVLSLGKSKIENAFFESLNPGEKKEFSLPTYAPLEKKIGIDEVKGMISVIDTSGKIIAEENITIRIPIARIGDTIRVEGKHNLLLTPLSWKESNIAVDGPYGEDEYYTFTAKPGMKFIILIFKFQNNWIRPQETPYLNAGEIATDKGHIYTVWDPPVGIYSEEYKPRKATDEEVEVLVGDSGAYEDLLPGKSTVGCVVFEIPKDEIPIEASIVYVPPLIRYEGGAK